MSLVHDCLNKGPPDAPPPAHRPERTAARHQDQATAAAGRWWSIHRQGFPAQIRPALDTHEPAIIQHLARLPNDAARRRLVAKAASSVDWRYHGAVERFLETIEHHTTQPTRHTTSHDDHIMSPHPTRTIGHWR